MTLLRAPPILHRASPSTADLSTVRDVSRSRWRKECISGKGAKVDGRDRCERGNVVLTGSESLERGRRARRIVVAKGIAKRARERIPAREAAGGRAHSATIVRLGVGGIGICGGGMDDGRQVVREDLDATYSQSESVHSKGERARGEQLGRLAHARAL